ncbi:MAG: NUMOD3 domain-containing DNA-binding protein [Candidatus Omnitrophota bacterium]
MKRHLSEATKNKISLAQRGKKNSMYGKRHSKATLRKLSRTLCGDGNPMFGRRHAAATKRKISAALRKAWARRNK